MKKIVLTFVTTAGLMAVAFANAPVELNLENELCPKAGTIETRVVNNGQTLQTVVYKYDVHTKNCIAIVLNSKAVYGNSQNRDVDPCEYDHEGNLLHCDPIIPNPGGGTNPGGADPCEYDQDGNVIYCP